MVPALERGFSLCARSLSAKSDKFIERMIYGAQAEVCA